MLRSRHEISKLFRVCSESRQAALRFYRVQIPCYYKQRGHSPIEGTFYFHPELDTLHIVGSLMYFAMFADRLWGHDPRRAGLLNLALTGQTTSCQHHYLGFSMRKDHQRDLLRPALQRLRRVTFGFAAIIGRGFPCIQNFAGLWDELPGYKASMECQNQIRRSRPLLASISKFDRLPMDPRAIDEELKRVYIGAGDPRK